MDNKVYRIHQGKTTVGTTSSRLPSFVDTHWFEPGRPMPHSMDVVAAISAIASRCAPSMNILVGPRIWGSCDISDTDSYACRSNVRRRDAKTVEYQHHGVAYFGRGLVMVASDDTLPLTTTTLHHEIMHAMESSMHPEDLAAVNVAASRGLKRPGEYLDSPIERRARFYEWTAMAWDEGARPVMIGGVPVSRADRVLWHLYTGGLAREVASGRPARAQLFPGQRAGRWLKAAYQEIGMGGVLAAAAGLLMVPKLLVTP
jgi:hypothetical protein